MSITVTTLFVVLIFLPQPFFISKDAYRYIWDGMLIIKGENPYLYVPEDEKLKKYWEQDKLLARNKDPKATKTYQLYQNLDWKGLHTPYPPFAQFIFGLSYLAYMQFGIIGVRIILCLPIFVLAYLLYKNQSQKLACLLLLNPLVVSEIYYSAHIDSYVLLFIYLAITTFEKQKEIKASFWTALGFITKLYPAFLVPFFTAKLIKEKKFRLLAICASCFMLISVIAWAPFINHGFEPIKRYLTLPDEQEYNASIYRWTYQILEKQNILNANNCGAKQNCQSLTEEKQVAKYASLAILIIGTIYLMSKDFSINVLLSAGILYLFVSPLVFPWHTLFLIPLVFISVMKNKNYKLLIPLFLYQVIVAWAYFEPQSKSTRDLMLNIEYALAIVLIILYAFILKNQYKFDYRK
ncbi:MAG: glycosyltransferase 87 family protein [Patescibacteria group bacterium]|nr:glycosyltransferase 87 family protein [Patescibacteria group bacterium]